MRMFWQRLARDTKGVTAVEYGLIIGLIVIAMFVALAELASRTSIMWNNVATAVTNS